MCSRDLFYGNYFEQELREGYRAMAKADRVTAERHLAAARDALK